MKYQNNILYNMGKLWRFWEWIFSTPKQHLDIPVVVSVLYSEWIEFDKQKPPHEVVLAACDTYDCGWTMDTVWWNEDKLCWMVTGAVQSTKAHLSYTHWRKLPPFPNEV